MRLLLSLVLLLLACLFASAQISLGPGISIPPRTGGSVNPAINTPQVINILDYGALCDGTTDDTGAINAAFQAARTSPIYLNGGVVHISGVADATHKSCRVTSVNATSFTQPFTTEQLVISDLSLTCFGAGSICLDLSSSIYYHLRNVEVSGDASDPPQIGIQIGGYMAGLSSCCIATMSQVQTSGSFTLAALYSDAAESMSFYGNRFRNNGLAIGPIRSLGAITGGSGYTDGFYSRVPMQGGSGSSAAIAFVRVEGGAVTYIDVSFSGTFTCFGCYQGKDYQIGDVLTINAGDIGGTGSGFSIPVESVAGYSVIMDGLNHWRQRSAYVTVTNPVDQFITYTYNSWFGGAITFGAANTDPANGILGAAVWDAGPRSLIMDNVYLQVFNSPTWCVEVYTGAVNIDQKWRSGCEVGSTVHSAFHILGPNGSPEMVSFSVDSAANMASVPYIFSNGPNMTNINMRNVDFLITIASGATFFEHPQLFEVSGNAKINRPEIWNMPRRYSGTLCVGGPPDPPTNTVYLSSKGVCASPNGPSPNLGPLEISGTGIDRTDPDNPVVVGAVGAWSCSRRLIALYTGPLCQIERTNADTTVSDMDIYPNALGDFDTNAASIFCLGVTCRVHTIYDQTIAQRLADDPAATPNDAVQATAADQPELQITDSQIAGHASVNFGASSSKRLIVTASDTIANIFASTAGGTTSTTAGGFINFMMSRTGSSAVDRIMSKTDGTTGWQFRNAATFTSKPEFVQGATTTAGTWTSNDSVAFSHGDLYELQYYSGSLANVPIITTQGNVNTLISSVQPVGTIGDDSAIDLTIGNYPGLNRGMDGALAEAIIYNSPPSALRRQAIERNQAIYYGIGTSVP